MDTPPDLHRFNSIFARMGAALSNQAFSMGKLSEAMVHLADACEFADRGPKLLRAEEVAEAVLLRVRRK